MYQQTLNNVDAYCARQKERDAKIEAIQKKISEHQLQSAAKLERDWAVENNRVRVKEAAVSKVRAEMNQRREALQRERLRQQQLLVYVHGWGGLSQALDDRVVPDAP